MNMLNTRFPFSSLQTYLTSTTYLLLLLLTLVMTWGNANLISIFSHQFSLVTIFGWLLLIVWLSKVCLSGCQLLPDWTFLAVFLLFLGVSLSWSIDKQATMAELRMLMPAVLYGLMLYDLSNTETRLRRVCQAYIIGAFICAITIIGYAIMHIYLYANIRGTAFEYNPNDIAYLLVLPLVFIPYLNTTAATNAKRKIEVFFTYFNYVYIYAATLAVFLTCSKSGILALAMVALYFISAYRKVLFRGKILFILMMLASSMYFFWVNFHPPYNMNFMGNVIKNVAPIESKNATKAESHPKPTLNQRLEILSDDRTKIWEAGLSIPKQHVYLGSGFGTYSNNMNTILHTQTSAHNIFIQLLSELGIIGIGIFALWYFKIGYRAWRSPKHAMLLTAWLICTAEACLNNTLAMKPTWLLLGFIVIVSMLAKNKEANEKIN